MSLHARRRGLLVQWPTILWLALVWVLLWGELTWANVLGGLGVGVVVTLVFPLPAMGFSIKVRPWHMLRLAWYFLSSLVQASFQVAWQALSPRSHVHGAVVGVRLRNPADLYLTVTAELSTLVPGTLVVEAQRITGMLYLHVLDLAASGGEDAVRDDVLELEERVLYALASDEELVRAGLRVPGRRGRSGTASGASGAAAPDVLPARAARTKDGDEPAPPAPADPTEEDA
ncbi:Na+/H+ antiporter subunit E [Sanguibacter sp. HDW7]|uniref:Na+/H+ antiporter subunit E n=1 Tax=Sanguibacter sp. HDW7 TaxID=2714931 RepID=UPI00140BA0A7|nr:Na+/H+ antiporter subunit E [Sanguibacter sp. HDW7]